MIYDPPTEKPQLLIIKMTSEMLLAFDHVEAAMLPNTSSPFEECHLAEPPDSPGALQSRHNAALECPVSHVFAFPPIQQDSESEFDYRAVLTAFYAARGVLDAKRGSIDAILAEYFGEERQMLVELHAKYDAPLPAWLHSQANRSGCRAPIEPSRAPSEPSSCSVTPVGDTGDDGFADTASLDCTEPSGGPRTLLPHTDALADDSDTDGVGNSSFCSLF